jgi:hypothetical protein
MGIHPYKSLNGNKIIAKTKVAPGLFYIFAKKKYKV